MRFQCCPLTVAISSFIVFTPHARVGELQETPSFALPPLFPVVCVKIRQADATDLWIEAWVFFKRSFLVLRSIWEERGDFPDVNSIVNRYSAAFVLVDKSLLCLQCLKTCRPAAK